MGILEQNVTSRLCLAYSKSTLPFDIQQFIKTECRSNYESYMDSCGNRELDGQIYLIILKKAWDDHLQLLKLASFCFCVLLCILINVFFH